MLAKTKHPQIHTSYWKLNKDSLSYKWYQTIYVNVCEDM